MDIVSTLVEHGARTSAESRVSFCLCFFVIFGCYGVYMPAGASNVNKATRYKANVM